MKKLFLVFALFILFFSVIVNAKDTNNEYILMYDNVRGRFSYGQGYWVKSLKNESWSIFGHGIIYDVCAYDGLLTNEETKNFYSINKFNKEIIVDNKYITNCSNTNIKYLIKLNRACFSDKFEEIDHAFSAQLEKYNKDKNKYEQIYEHDLKIDKLTKLEKFTHNEMESFFDGLTLKKIYTNSTRNEQIYNCEHSWTFKSLARTAIFWGIPILTFRYISYFSFLVAVISMIIIAPYCDCRNPNCTYA
jgi:hypothetical protein